ncbi:MAG: RNA methyltransferase [Candidatus Caenarcaniphilales bacterium]|nr:RNA methyltransferase [Candidatus Caenarcaniphilales bacterium]
MPTPERLEKITRVANARQHGIVVLEDIYDPHNAIAVFRSCDAFAVQEIYLVFDKQQAFDPKEMGKATSTSANKWVDFKIFDSIENAYADLSKRDYKTYATVLSDDTLSLYETNLLETEKVAFVLGNEKRGLSEKAIEGADNKIMIPMQGMIQSLNLSVTASICLFELNRQRKSSNNFEQYLLSPGSNSELIKDFCER